MGEQDQVVVLGWAEGLGEALRLFRALLPNLERVLGPDHPATLDIPNSAVAYRNGKPGDES